MVRLTERSDSWSGNANELRAASTAGGGTALTTTAALVVIPDGTTHLSIAMRNFSTAVVGKVALNPYLLVYKTTDSLATAPTDMSVNAQDGSASTLVTLSALPTFANGGAVYIGSHLMFRGMVATVVGANGNTATLAVKYWTGSAFSTITPTDGTASGGKTLAATGNITWTVPTDWARQTLASIFQSLDTPKLVFTNTQIPLYWLRCDVSAALSATVTLSGLQALNRSTAYGEIVDGSVFSGRVYKGLGGVASVEALTDAGTGNMIVNAFVEPEGMFT